MRRITLLTNPNLCNLRCPLCFLKQCNVAVDYGEMPIEVAVTAIEKYADERDAHGNRILREVIPSTMGEPLLYSKFDELLKCCEASGLKLNLTTNGTFPGKWGSDCGMERLLNACSDIKISTLSYEMGGISYSQWRDNVVRLMEFRRRLEQAGSLNLASVSLQVTLHGKNMTDAGSSVEWASRILHFAETVGICRIKWNRVVLLNGAPRSLRELYDVDESLYQLLRNELQSGKLRSSKVKFGGSLFFEGSAGLCPVGGMCDKCPFEDEVWVWPDGHEDHCPNPERRWGC